MIRARWRPYQVAVALRLTVLPLALLFPASAVAGPLFSSADTSTLVVRGTVEAVTPFDAAKLQVFRIKVDRVLKGDVAVGDTVALAQEMLFESTKPYFSPGTDTLILAVPLPNYSAFRKVLPTGTYWRWTERLETAADVAMLGDPALTEGVARYLATRADAEASADFLTATLIGGSARLRHDALVVIGQRPEIPPLLDTGRLQPLAAWLQDERQPVPERALVIVNLARDGAPGIVSLARDLTAVTGSLQAPAVDALVSMNEVPPLDRLVGWTKSSDEALRLAASRGLAKGGSPAALDRLGEMLEHETSGNVRLAIVQGLGSVASERAVGMLARELAKPDKTVGTAAADSLGRLATPEAIAALGAALEKGSSDAQAASAFALKRSGTRDGLEILEHQEANHPDPNVRRLCQLALGESMHTH
jgi:HEAT repeat protein